jgi:hypothetical protein
MAIKGMTDRVSLGLVGLPNIGALRKGDKNKNGQFGDDLDHFRFTSNRPGVEDAFYAYYAGGDRTSKELLRSVFVYLPYAEPEQNFQTCKEAYTAGAFMHRCDGEVMSSWRNKEGIVVTNDPRPCTGGCKEIGRLCVMLPGLWKQGYIGYVNIETHAKNDLPSIMKTLWDMYERRQLKGLDLRDLAFIVRRVPELISTPKSAKEPSKRVRREKYWAEMQLKEANFKGAISGTQKALNAAEEVLGEPEEAEPEQHEDNEHLEYIRKNGTQAQLTMAENALKKNDLEMVLRIVETIKRKLSV